MDVSPNFQHLAGGGGVARLQQDEGGAKRREWAARAGSNRAAFMQQRLCHADLTYGWLIAESWFFSNGPR